YDRSRFSVGGRITRDEYKDRRCGFDGAASGNCDESCSAIGPSTQDHLPCGGIFHFSDVCFCEDKPCQSSICNRAKCLQDSRPIRFDLYRRVALQRSSVKRPSSRQSSSPSWWTDCSPRCHGLLGV